MEWGFLPSIVSAAAGLGGVWLGAELTSRRELRREADQYAKDIAYLAIIVSAHLQRFVDGCVSVVDDDGTSYGEPAGEGGYYETTVATPIFEPLTLTVNWKVLPPRLMDEIMSLPYHIESLNRRIAGVGEFDDPPDFSEYFWERRHGYAVLGLRVSSVADRLRQHARLDIASTTETAWSKPAYLKEKKSELEVGRKTRPQANDWPIAD
ncbi:hypothetical protein [Burkholderia gladioli]|uniref:hypothetical protein n=1 Tax=Burkholderia gladioli TaxID=28095 RepID=UPI00163E6961|nr:hypothetical protein [Burkholderia gladioli]